MKEPQIAISVRNLVKFSRARKVLDGINLDVYQGETFVVWGARGAGRARSCGI